MLSQNLHGYGFNDDMEEIPPYFVRRWAPKVKYNCSKIPSISVPCYFFFLKLKLIEQRCSLL